MPFLNPAQLVAAYGAYYKEGNINSKNLHKQIFLKSETEMLFPMTRTNDTRVDDIQMNITSVLQPFYAKFSSLGALDFEPNKWNLDRMKINIQMTPDDLAATALDFMVQKGLYRKEAPLIAMVSEMILEKAKEDTEEHLIFKGVYKLPSSQDQASKLPGAPVDSMTGIRHKIRLYNAAGKFTSLGSMIAMGAVPTDPVLFVEYMETLHYSVPEKYRVFIKSWNMSKTLETRFKRGMRIKYNVNYPQVTDMATIIDTTCSIKGLFSHEGSDMVWSTLSGNLDGRIKSPENENMFNVSEKEVYDVLIATDYYKGVDFVNPHWIWGNGRDLTLPA